MKNIKQFLLNLGIGFVALNLFGWAFCTGESFPPQPMSTKEVMYLRVPAISPISP
jgi:hypothetical protein